MWLETVHVFGAMTVAMPMLYANGNIIRIQVCLVSMMSCVLLSFK